ncbi:MAG: DM13 domain-containing protein [Cyanobacteria bacterium P01_E01_bin.6]
MKLTTTTIFGLSLLFFGSVAQATLSPLSVRAESITNQTKQTIDLLDAGKFVTSEGQTAPTTGSAIVFTINGQQFVQLSQDFSTANGPDVEVIIYEHNSVPVSIEGTGEYVSLGQLNEFEGRQRYAVPDDVDISQFGSIGIWCEQFDVTFGYLSL